MSLSRGRRVIENINIEIIQNLREKIETHVIVKYFSALLVPMISTYKLANGWQLVALGDGQIRKFMPQL